MTRKSSAINRVRCLVSSLIILILILIGLFISFAFGAVEIPLSQIFDVLTSTSDDVQKTIILDSRLPRALVAILVGCNLALSGVLLQTVTRNALADPGIIGVTAGAALAATIVLVIIPKISIYLPIAAFVGALISAFFVYTVSWRPGVGSSPIRMILAGVAINSILGAFIGLLMVAFADRIPAMMFWTSGTFNGRGWDHFNIILPYTLIGLLLSIYLKPSLSVMELGDDVAISMGVSVEKTRLIAFVAAALLAGSAASVAGLVGFIGLVVPHLVRLILGGNKWLIPVSALGGSALLLWSDIIAKLTFAPAEMPVGVVTGLIGGPYFVFLLYKTKWLR